MSNPNTTPLYFIDTQLPFTKKPIGLFETDNINSIVDHAKANNLQLIVSGLAPTSSFSVNETIQDIIKTFGDNDVIILCPEAISHCVK